MPELTQWNNFYVIVGSSAGALIGLQFVVIALIADVPVARADAQASAAFSTPSVVHFGVALLTSALIVAPWRGLAGLMIFWCVIGLAGILYSLNILKRMRRQTAYKPVFEDWLFHFILPCVAYTSLCGAALTAALTARVALFIVGGVALLLLFVGIHNAWDTATYHVLVRTPAARKKVQ
jgi:hypothetical protein